MNPTKAEYKAMQDAALGTGHHQGDSVPLSLPSVSPMALVIVTLAAVSGMAILAYAIISLF